MTRHWRTLLPVAIALLALACRDERVAQAPAAESAPPTAATQAPFTPEQAAEARRTLAAWLECEECVDGELDAVLRLGAQAVPTLVATLERGPSPAARELVRRELRARHAELEQRALGQGTPLPPTDVEAWIDEQIESYVARYQVRSAQALAKLGGPEAERALRAVQASGTLREDVAGVVHESLSKPR